MLPDIRKWSPLNIEGIQNMLGEFDKWCLCGGKSLDLFMGRETREHGDTDIGVFRSDLEDCLTAIGKDLVFLCDPPGQHKQWSSSTVPEHVDDIWLLSPDAMHWVLQILVFSDDRSYVYYKRNRALKWRKESHTARVGDVYILNPMITLLYKANQKTLEDMDIQDIRTLIENDRT